MKRSPQKSTTDLSKSFKKEGAFKLDQAIEKMSSLLGSHLDVRGHSEISTNTLEDYVALLNERYNKIVELLSEEEEGLIVAQKENSELKAKLAEEVKSHQDTVSMAKGEIDGLLVKNKEALARKHVNNMERQYKEIEIKCNEEKIEYLENEIKKEMEAEIQLKAEVNDLERQNNFLDEELNSLKAIQQTEETRSKQLEKKFEELQKSYDHLKKQTNILKTKHNEVEQKMNGISSQKNNFNDNIEKIIQEQKSILKKTHVNYQKLTEMEKIKKKIVEEIEVKHEQLNLIRGKNQDLENRIKTMDFLDKDIKIQEEIHSQLTVENEVLNRHLEEISNILGKNSSNRLLNESNSKISDSKHLKEFESLLKNHPDFNKQNGFDPNEILEQNNKFRLIVNELEKEIQEKMIIIENQKEKIVEIEGICESNNQQIKLAIDDKRILESQYEELSSKMGLVSSNFLNQQANQSFKSKSEKKTVSKGNEVNYSFQNGEKRKDNGFLEEKKNYITEKNNKIYDDMEILNKNPIKLEMDDLMKSMNVAQSSKKQQNELKTLDNF